MKPIRLSKHAQEQCLERGTNELEVVHAIRTGICQKAKAGRFKYQATFQYDAVWQGKFYTLKKVAPVVAETELELVVITVYTFYF
ncbi:MAG: DUF4258 domain-containing protein [Woronichinia naegeliana WA131]|jgi:hypothetical protein|uniref:DUF4258 domain-containing protein n=1 Tax=Woronichinia naegeliana WA131 TaxID=2824559 RepID=A0A977PYL7_9CYAN|nr:MAG: DUF4258 domain-containing protein [Woronichinia naegeliana WA131]